MVASSWQNSSTLRSSPLLAYPWPHLSAVFDNIMKALAFAWGDKLWTISGVWWRQLLSMPGFYAWLGKKQRSFVTLWTESVLV